MNSRSRCELVRSPHKRAIADQRAASIAAAFPPGLAQPALRTLAGAGLRQLDDLRHITEQDLAELHGMGPKALGILNTALTRQGASFLRRRKAS